MWMVVLLPLGMLLVGHGLANLAAPTGRVADAVTLSGGTRVVTSVETVTRKVRGRIVRVADKVYVHVPLVVIHVDHRTIRVPAHKLPLRSAAAVVANPLVTVRVEVPTTVYLPTTVTVTTTATTWVPTTTTISLPLTSGDPPAS